MSASGQFSGRIAFTCYFLTCFYSAASEADTTVIPFLSGEASVFENDSTPLTKDQVLSLIPGVNTELNSDNFSFVGKFAYRFDTFDKKRDLLYIGENFVRWQNDEGNHLIRFGHQRLHLGALEILQGIDSINDYVTDSFSPEIQRRGYPMLNYRYTDELYKAEFFLFPYFEAPYYPPNSSRMGYGFQFDKQQAVASDDSKQDSGFRSDQFGAKFDVPTENVDLSFGHFHLVDRSTSVAALDQDNQFSRYFFMSDFSFASFQAVAGNTIFKGNFVHKNFHGATVTGNDILTGNDVELGIKEHSTASLGMEIKLPFTESHDTTLTMEVQKLMGVDPALARRYSVFSNDAAWGIRHSFNDIRSRLITIGHVIDLQNADEQIFQVDYKQTITDNMKINLGARIIKAGRKDQAFSFDNLTGLALMDDADCMYLTLTNYF